MSEVDRLLDGKQSKTSIVAESSAERNANETYTQFSKNSRPGVVRFSGLERSSEIHSHRHDQPHSSEMNGQPVEPILQNVAYCGIIGVPAHAHPGSGGKFEENVYQPQNDAAHYGAIAPVIAEANPHEVQQIRRHDRLPEDPAPVSSRVKYTYTGLLLSFIIVMSIVALVIIWVAMFTSGIYSTYISYTVILGVALSILVYVALPACVYCSRRVDGEPRQWCSAKFTLYVSVFLAASFLFVGTSLVGVMQIVFTTECPGTRYITSSTQQLQAWGSVIGIISFLTAIVCFFVATVTIRTCYNDHSRKCSNVCVKIFVSQLLLYLSGILTFVVTTYSSFSQAERSIYDNSFYILPVIVSSIEGGVLGILLSFLMFAGPALCMLDAERHRHFTKVSRIYMIVISFLVIAGYFAAGVIMVILSSHISRLDASKINYYDCMSWRKTPSLAMSLFSALLNLGVACLGLISFIFGCYGVRSPNVQWNNDY